MPFTVIIPYRNGEQHIKRLLDTIPSYVNVVLVDDHSRDRSFIEGLAKEYRADYLRNGKRRYFTGAVNDGIEWVGSNYDTDVLILNQDTYFDNTYWIDWINQCLDEGFAMFGERIMGTHPAFEHGYIHGTFLYLTRDVVKECGLMDEEFFPLWGSTAAYQIKVARAGFNILPTHDIPGFVHKRLPNQRFGSSITELLAESNSAQRDLFIRTPPLISVVVPCYNYAHYLTDAVHSLVGGETSMGTVPQQTFTGFEVIIVDDASTDNTPEIGRKLANGWTNVHYLRLNQNVGTAEAVNYGVRASHGRYVTMLSADDMRTPESLEIMLREAQKRPDEFVYDTPAVYRNGQIEDNWPLPEYDPVQLLRRNMVPATWMVRRNHYEKANGIPKAFRDGREDWAFAVALLQVQVCGHRIENSGYLYRREGQNRTLRNTDSASMEMFQTRMTRTFPALYYGRIDPMGCCGKKKTNNVPVQQAVPSQTLAPQAMEQGMTLITYTGASVGSQRWRGPSGANYIFGANDRDRTKNVADMDVQYFLTIRENGRDAFMLTNTSETEHKPAAEPAPKAMVEIGEAPQEASPVADEGQSEVETTGDYDALPDDPGELTITDIKSLNLSAEDWVRLYEMEYEGKARKTLLDWLDDQVL